jgi:ribosomal protein S18 acetylase RimI-like enzyme
MILKIAFVLLGKVVGFVSGTPNIGKFYRNFLKKNFAVAIAILLQKHIIPQFTRKVIETLFYPLRKKENLPNAELLSIVVIKNYQGEGVSKDLFHKLTEEFKERKINLFKIVVGNNLVGACHFYEKMGCIFHSVIEIHKGEKSRVYVHEVK